MAIYAHTLQDQPKETWELLFTPFGEIDPNDPRKACSGKNGAPCPHCEQLAPYHGHLNKVAWWAAKFAAEMFPPGPDRDAARQWGYLAGLWHDLGKFAPEWQAYLASKADIHADEASGSPSKREDHSSAGAIFASTIPAFGPLLSYIIAGHHAGLADASYLFNERLPRPVNEWCSHAEESGFPLDKNLPIPPFSRADAGSDGLALLTRFFFSSLVDADFLATESFMNPERKDARPNRQPTIANLESTLATHLEKLIASAPATSVNHTRTQILGHCLTAAGNPPGLFSLTVPTGGGKTLASLAFALKHARLYDLRRVIYVIPFTSIIEQNAAVFRKKPSPPSAPTSFSNTTPTSTPTPSTKPPPTALPQKTGTPASSSPPTFSSSNPSTPTAPPAVANSTASPAPSSSSTKPKLFPSNSSPLASAPSKNSTPITVLPSSSAPPHSPPSIKTKTSR
ncbi:MAG: CRISPR-associated endonuclease Cas3'' [Luteolibacter sp.]